MSERFNDNILKMLASIEHQKLVEEKKLEREKKLREKELSRREFLNKLGKAMLAGGLVALGVKNIDKIIEKAKEIGEDREKDMILFILSHSEIKELEVPEGGGLWSLYQKSGWNKRPELIGDYYYFEQTLKVINPDKFNEEGKLIDPKLAYIRRFLVPVYKEEETISYGLHDLGKEPKDKEKTKK